MTAQWSDVSLDDLCLSDGLVRGPFGGSLKKGDFVSRGYQVYEQRHAINGTFEGARYFIDPRKFDEMKRFSVKPGDFIVSCSGTIGRIYQIPEGAPEGIINQALLKISVDRDVVDPRFFASYFQWDRFQDQILDSTQGGAMQNLVGMAIFRKSIIYLPSIDEQRLIADALVDMDESISELEQLVAKKQSIKCGTMQQLLTGKTRLPGFSDPWSSVHLSEVGTFIKGRGIKRDDVRRTGVPCIRYGELYTEFTDYTSHTRSFVDDAVAATALPIRSGDLLFAGSGETREDIGKCVAYTGSARAVAGGDIVILRGSGFNPVYLASLTNTPLIANQKSRRGQGDAVVHISSRALGDIQVSLPPLVEQDAIATVLLDADSEIRVLKARLFKARGLKHGMMQELLSGKTRLKPRELMA